MESGQAHEAPSFSIISSEENVDDRVSDNVEVPSLPTLNAGGLFEEKHPGLGSGCHVSFVFFISSNFMPS